MAVFVDGGNKMLTRLDPQSDLRRVIDVFNTNNEQIELVFMAKTRMSDLDEQVLSAVAEALGTALVAVQLASNAESSAATAQSTANVKVRAFYTQPTPPYAVGDLWVQGESGDIQRAVTSKPQGGSFNTADWTMASKYGVNMATGSAATSGGGATAGTVLDTTISLPSPFPGKSFKVNLAPINLSLSGALSDLQLSVISTDTAGGKFTVRARAKAVSYTWDATAQNVVASETWHPLTFAYLAFY